MFNFFKRLNKEEKWIFGLAIFAFMLGAVAYGVDDYVQNRNAEKQKQQMEAEKAAWRKRSADFAEYYALEDIRKYVADYVQKFPNAGIGVPEEDADRFFAGRVHDSIKHADAIVRDAGLYIHNADQRCGCEVSFEEAARSVNSGIKNGHMDALILKQNIKTLREISVDLAIYRLWKRRICEGQTR